MSITHLLEDFSTVTISPVIELTELRLEEERLDSFEKGYQAGWDDSAAAGKSEAGQLSNELSQTLKDLSFTYHEAYAGITRALDPVIRQLVETVLPPIARRMVAPHVTSLLRDLIAQHGRHPVTLICAPQAKDVLEQLSQKEDALPLRVESDESLSEGQVEIRFGDAAESELDLDQLLAGVSEALDAFFKEDMTEYKETA